MDRVLASIDQEEPFDLMKYQIMATVVEKYVPQLPSFLLSVILGNLLIFNSNLGKPRRAEQCLVAKYRVIRRVHLGTVLSRREARQTRYGQGSSCTCFRPRRFHPGNDAEHRLYLRPLP